MKYDIFISYRREDGSGRSNVPTARQFKLAFEAPPYNYKVFFDYSECTDNYFSDTILPAIRTCDFFVLVLTKDCLLRCSNERDWVRREIEEAIAYNRKIIPITPDKECETFPSGLPDLLKRTFDGLQITTVYTDHMFEASVDFLVKNRFHLNKEYSDSEAEHKAKEEAERARLKRERVAKVEAERKVEEAADRERLKCVDGVANGHEYVDLGLPSGTLWATCNVGASKPEDYGDYFSWGETEPKTFYTWNTYKYANGSRNKLTKYCSHRKHGNRFFKDNLTTLQPRDDSAASWGSGWNMPIKAQWEELIKNTTNKMTSRNGVYGVLFIANNGNSLFLPCRKPKSVGSDHFCCYWSSSLCVEKPDRAWSFVFALSICKISECTRELGLSVRAVRFAF